MKTGSKFTDFIFRFWIIFYSRLSDITKEHACIHSPSRCNLRIISASKETGFPHTVEFFFFFAKIRLSLSLVKNLISFGLDCARQISIWVRINQRLDVLCALLHKMITVFYFNADMSLNLTKSLTRHLFYLLDYVIPSIWKIEIKNPIVLETNWWEFSKYRHTFIPLKKNLCCLTSVIMKYYLV